MHWYPIASVLALFLAVCQAEISCNILRCQIVKAHDDARRLVAQGKVTDKAGKKLPPAADMAEMKWDENLAKAAQAWADTCSMKHDDRNTELKTGENLAMTTDIFADESNMVKWWVDEITKDDYTGDVPAKFEDPAMKAIGHFTQVVWSKSARIGCGSKDCNGTKFFVCRYSPYGNMLGSPVYEKGETCSKCASGCNNGLCKTVVSDDPCMGMMIGDPVTTVTEE